MELGKDFFIISNYVPNEELGKYFAVSDVVVLPYVTATQSAALQTAYAFDKPVISTPVGGLKDVMKDGVTGYIADPESADDLTKKVKKFYTSWKPSKELEKFISQFSYQHYIQILEKI